MKVVRDARATSGRRRASSSGDRRSRSCSTRPSGSPRPSPGTHRRSRSGSSRARRRSASSPSSAARASRASSGPRRARRRRAELQGIGTWINTPGEAADLARRAARARRARRLLDVLVHQLPADAPPAEGVGRGVPGRRAHDRRRPQPGVRLRARAGQRPVGGERLGVRYPVALDNDFATWRAYSNQYWPAKYLVDRTGSIRYHHFGEGGGRGDREADQELLGEGVGEPPRLVRRRRPAASGRRSRISATTASRGSGMAGRLRIGSRGTRSRRARCRRTSSRTPAAGRSRASGSWPVRARDCSSASRPTTSFWCWRARAGRGAGRRPAAPRRSASPGSRACTRSPASELPRGPLELRFSPGVAGYAFTFG